MLLDPKGGDESADYQGDELGSSQVFKSSLACLTRLLRSNFRRKMRSTATQICSTRKTKKSTMRDTKNDKTRTCCTPTLRQQEPFSKPSTRLFLYGGSCYSFGVSGFSLSSTGTGQFWVPTSRCQSARFNSPHHYPAPKHINESSATSSSVYLLEVMFDTHRKITILFPDFVLVCKHDILTF